MKKIFYTLLILTSAQTAISQSCNSVIAPHAPSGSGGGNYHVYSDTTITDMNGSNYYICSGVTVTVTYSAGCSYQLEDNVTLTITDHEGDFIYAKGNCTIVDNSIEAIVVNMESTSTFSKPNNTPAGIVFTCSPMVFDYSAVGGSSPCTAGINNKSELNSDLKVFPNPVQGSGKVEITVPGERVQLFDLSGVLVAEYANPNENYIQLNDILTGVYFLIVESESGERLATRLVVE